MDEVKIRTSTEIQCGEGKWLHMPPSLIEEHEGQQFLRFRPSSHSIVSLVTQAPFEKNATISNSSKLQDLVKLRNEALAALHEGGDGEEGDQNKADMWEDVQGANDPPKVNKKRKRQGPVGSHVVKIKVDEKPVHLLCQGTRPSKADLLVKLVPEDLSVVLAFLKENVEEALCAAKKQYKKAKKDKEVK